MGLDDQSLSRGLVCYSGAFQRRRHGCLCVASGAHMVTVLMGKSASQVLCRTAVAQSHDRWRHAGAATVNHTQTQPSH